MKLSRPAQLFGLVVLIFGGVGGAGGWKAPLALHAQIPIACGVELQSAPLSRPTTALIELGQTLEVCNAPQGYRLYAQLLDQELTALLLVDQQPVLISGKQETVIAEVAGAGTQSRGLALASDQASQASRITLRIEPRS